MKIHGSREDPELEVERKELEDQVGGLDRKLSSIKDKGSETEVGLLMRINIQYNSVIRTSYRVEENVLITDKFL